MNQPTENINQEWDVIVIGTGIGGATVGYQLAKEGIAVLFLEKGQKVDSNEGWVDENNPENRLAQGWWPYPVSQTTKNGKVDKFYAAVGCALGGSSINYGAALERFDVSDFDALNTQNQTLEPWVVSYKQFLPFYEEAEALYGISSTKKLPKLNEWDQSFMQVMQQSALKPERLNIAIDYDDNCIECIGKVCERKCKADAKTACLDKALKLPNCSVLSQCEVVSLEANKSEVKHIIANYNGKRLQLTAKKVILAAGALHSPQLLLKSKSADWPNGLANSSDQVGRNLMFHISDMYAVWSPKKLSRKGLQKKSLSIRDFYIKDGKRLGYIQSLGLDAGQGHISMFMKDTLRKFGIHNKFILSALTKVPAIIVARILGDASLLAINIEDDPMPDNKITLDSTQPNGSRFSYTIPKDIQERANELYKLFSSHIKPWRILRVMPKLEINHGHACGTCRFGNDAATSVLDHNCKAHDIDNLYIVDSSFMPRSGAANPSLTIAANAIRVAENITASLTKKSG